MYLRTKIRPLLVMEKRKSYIPHLLAVLLGWSLAMTLDFYDQKRAAEERYAEVDMALTQCFKGEWRTTTEDGVEWGCLPVQRFDPKNKSKVGETK